MNRNRFTAEQIIRMCVEEGGWKGWPESVEGGGRKVRPPLPDSFYLLQFEGAPVEFWPL